jgi:hypothetical protein
MTLHNGPLLAEDGAYLLVKFDRRERQVIVRTKVCLDLPDRSMNEPPQRQICTSMSVAHEHALEVAASRSLPVIWEDAEFVASVAYVGGYWQGGWAIRVGAFELESDVTNYRDEQTARSMVKVDARNHGYGNRVSWQDGYVEPSLDR